MFSIDSAYKRRESALQFYGDLKGHAQSLYFGVRDWVDNRDHGKEAAVFKEKLVALFRQFFDSAFIPKWRSEAIIRIGNN